MRISACGIILAGALMALAGLIPEDMNLTFICSGGMFLVLGTVFLTSAKTAT